MGVRHVGALAAVLAVTASACTSTEEAAGSPPSSRSWPPWGETIDAPFANDGPVNEQARSGTRLRARWLETAAGAREFLGWFDKELGAPCAFEEIADGSLRCVPGDAGMGVFASNSACNDEIFAEPKARDCGYRRFAIRRTNDCRYKVEEVIPLSARRPASPVYLWEMTSWKVFSCVAHNDWVSYEREPPIPLEHLVRGHYAMTRAFEGLAAGYVVADDGAVAFASFVDTGLQLRCYLSLAEDASTRCLPSEAVVGERSFFADTECTQPVAQNFCQQVPSRVIARYTSINPNCDAPKAFSTAGEERTIVAYQSDGLCSGDRNIGVVGSGPLVGDPIPPTRFALGTPREDPPRGRLGATGFTTPGGWFYRRGWKDATRNEACSFVVATDGRHACEPSAVRIEDLYSDDLCGQRLAIDQQPSCTDVRYASALDGESCPPRRSIHPVTSRVKPAAIYGVNPYGTCEERVAAYPFFYYRFGDAIDVTEFESANERVE